MITFGISVVPTAEILKRIKQKQEGMSFKKVPIYSIDAITVE
jgi:hypothetical protein